MPAGKDRESRGFEYPAGWNDRMEAARGRGGFRSVNALFAKVMGDYLDDDERRAALDVTPAREKRAKGAR